MFAKIRIVANPNRVSIGLMHGDKQSRAATAICGALVLASLTGFGEEIPHLTVAQPGGFPGLPLMTGIERVTNGVRITWDGPSGYYQLYKKTALTNSTWTKTGTATSTRSAVVTNIQGNAFFKVAGPSPQYAGSPTCAECHEGVHNIEASTRHSQALQTLKGVNQDKNPACLPCHTVGYGLPTGFKSETATPHLAGVQCESCHGPAANHAANEMDFSVRPRKELAGEVCGGCHNGSHHPTFDEWKSSGHFKVVEDMNPSGRISSCGRCHSGSARLALIKGENPSVTVTNDANVGITCAVCHDPHQNHVWTNVLTRAVSTNQLRYAIASTNDFSLGTSDNFTNKYDPNINVCAQCHNHRGAAWTSSSRPPHHSPQYNILLGTVGVLPTNAAPWRATHATDIARQCVGCHMPTEEYQSESHPGMTGHSFRVESFNSCLECHPLPELLVDFTGFVVTNRISQLKASLDLWATTKSPLALRTNYGALAWEYSTPGELSAGTAGPTTTQQAQIPDNIKKARFNLYLIKYDGSLGVHNPLHSLDLLDYADGCVQEELNK